MIDTRGTKTQFRFMSSRRDFLRFLAVGGTALGLFAGGDHISPPLWEQYVTWQETNCDLATFLKKYAKPLAQVEFGANLCPDYRLMAAKVDPDRTVKILKDYFGCRHIRLGMRWSTHDQQGIDAYDRWIEALLKYDFKTVLGYGAKAPFPPETHFPKAIEENLDKLGAPKGSTIHVESQLGQLTLAYTDKLLTHLERAFGLDSFYGFNAENEFDANYGVHALAVGEDLLRAHAQRLYSPQHKRHLLINTAIISFPFHPPSLTMAVNNALALREAFPTLVPIVGTDIYEETDAGRISANLYVDTFAGVRLRHGSQLIPQAKKTLKEAGIPLEVTEFQFSEWVKEPRRHEPGSRLHMQYLLARMADYLVDEAPAPSAEPFLARLWEMSAFLLNMLEDEQFFYRNDAHLLIQAINQQH